MKQDGYRKPNVCLTLEALEVRGPREQAGAKWRPSMRQKRKRSQLPLGGTGYKWGAGADEKVQVTAGSTVHSWSVRYLWQVQRIGLEKDPLTVLIPSGTDLGGGLCRIDSQPGPWDASPHWFRQELVPFSWACSGIACWEHLQHECALFGGILYYHPDYLSADSIQSPHESNNLYHVSSIQDRTPPQGLIYLLKELPVTW